MISFAARCEQEPKLRRRLAAFQRLEASIVDEGVVNVISSLDWRSLGPAKVVEVSSQPTQNPCDYPRSLLDERH